jgi:two-component system chemotaxis response regulator CheB
MSIHNGSGAPLLALGASTGGTRALEEVIAALPINSPGTLVVQHIPSRFSRAFANKLNEKCALNVKEAEHGESIEQGAVYVAPGDRHLEVVCRKGDYFCRLLDTEPYRRHRPSVDVLFNSVARTVAANAVGVILTGMGRDGADGLLNIKQAGGFTIAQDEETSVVWGMPGSAVSSGAVDVILPLHQISGRVSALFGAAGAVHRANSRGS